MAPKVENMVDRRGNLQTQDKEEDLVAAAATRSTETVIKPNQIIIDGIIYDLDSFDHPGGDSINMFGGNDVTIMYRMIHPRHSEKYHTQKLEKVGTIQGYESEYQFGSAFEQELKREVFKIVKPGQELGTPGYLSRVVVYLALYFALQYYWVVHGSSYWLAIAYGVSCSLVGLAVQHDANHGAASRKTWINDLLGFGADLIGGNKWIWMEKHWTHHAYTNHKDKDPDGLSAEPMILFNSYPKGHPARKWYHPFQAVFFVPVLAGYWLSSMLSIMDLAMLIDSNSEAVGMKFDNAFTQKRRKWAVFSRMLYLFIHVVIPIWHLGFTWKVLGHVMTFGAAGSLALGLLFVLSHNFEGADRDPTFEVRKTNEPVCWYKSQVETSSTYGGWLSGALTGGLNFQIEHHLFPRMCSAWYPYIAPTVREICKKHGVKYTYYPWIWQNMIATMRFVHFTGQGTDIESKKEQ